VIIIFPVLIIKSRNGCWFLQVCVIIWYDKILKSSRVWWAKNCSTVKYWQQTDNCIIEDYVIRNITQHNFKENYCGFFAYFYLFTLYLVISLLVYISLRFHIIFMIECQLGAHACRSNHSWKFFLTSLMALS